MSSQKKLTQILTDNESWTLYEKRNATTQISQTLTNQRWRKKERGRDRGCDEEKDSKGGVSI